MIEIPSQLQKEEFRFILLNGKLPFEKEWQKTNNYSYKDPKFLDFIKDGNYGVLCGKGGLLVIDFDKKEVQEEVMPKLPKTFTVQTGGNKLLHKYFLVDDPKSFKALDKNKDTLFDAQGTGKQVVGANSKHPDTGNLYEVIDDSPIAEISTAELKASLSKYIQKEIEPKKEYGSKEENKEVQQIKNKIKIPEVLQELGISTNKNPTNCPLHNSKKGKCLSFEDDLWHCFHCEKGGDIFTLLMETKGWDFKTTLKYLAEKSGIKIAEPKNDNQTINIQNLENINSQQYANKKIKLTGSIFRLKKQDRITKVKYKCTSCGKIMATNRILPKGEKYCEVCEKDLKIIEKETTSGFLIILINDLTNIASSETIKMFAPCKSLGISLNPTTEQLEIGNILNKIGKTVNAEGTFKTIEKYDKNIQKWISQGEIEAEKIEFIDYLKGFTLTPKKYELLKEEFANKEWDDEQIEKTIIPEIIGRILTKKFMLLTALTVKELAKIGNKVIFGVGRGAIFGDPGEAKSAACKRFIDTYCKGLNALKITAETLSMAGLKGGVTKDGDEWIIDWGILPWTHGGMLVMDGYHSFDKQSIASLRETETNNTIEIFKIVKGSRECAFRGIKISNIRQQPIRKYYETKYDSSFDIGFGPQDQEGKFDDADRRRVDWIEVYSEEDVIAEIVDQSQFKLLTGEEFEQKSEQIKELIKFAWTRTVEHIDQTSLKVLIPLIAKILKEWREKYPSIKLSILGKEGAIIFSKYLLASAILHFNVNEKGIVIPNENDIMYVQNLFEEMFIALEVSKRLKLNRFNDQLAESIYQKMTDEQRIIFYNLGKAGTAKALCEKMGFVRSTFYNKFRDKIELFVPGGYCVQYHFFEGYSEGLIKIPPLINNGVITELGRMVSRIHKDTINNLKIEKEEKLKVVEEEVVKNNTYTEKYIFILNQIGLNTMPEQELYEKVTEQFKNITSTEFDQMIEKLLREGEIFKPKEGFIKII